MPCLSRELRRPRRDDLWRGPGEATRVYHPARRCGGVADRCAGAGRKFARIGALVLTSADAQSLAKALREGLREFGYAEGQNFAFEVRSADGNTDDCLSWPASWHCYR